MSSCLCKKKKGTKDNDNLYIHANIMLHGRAILFKIHSYKTKLLVLNSIQIYAV